MGDAMRWAGKYSQMRGAGWFRDVWVRMVRNLHIAGYFIELQIQGCFGLHNAHISIYCKVVFNCFLTASKSFLCENINLCENAI